MSQERKVRLRGKAWDPPFCLLGPRRSQSFEKSILVPEPVAQPFPRYHASGLLDFALCAGQARAMHAGSRSAAKSFLKSLALAKSVSRRNCDRRPRPSSNRPIFSLLTMEHNTC